MSRRFLQGTRLGRVSVTVTWLLGTCTGTVANEAINLRAMGWAPCLVLEVVPRLSSLLCQGARLRLRRALHHTAARRLH